jgi:phage portal protein BeeE
MFDKIRKMLKIGARNKGYSGGGRRVGWPGGLYGSAYDFYKGHSYDNTYSSVSKIVNEFMTIRPYAIDGNGKPLKDVRVINKLYHPNQQMSSVDFREALAVMTLVHRKVYLLLWREENREAVPGGDVTADNFAGCTFLEGVSEIVVGSEKRYQVGTNSYSTKEVIEIMSGFDPYNLGQGYSPSVAAKKWANLDDYIAAYQAGFFENGAVPAGEFIITAATADEFNKIVDDMQSRHRGSGRNNNVVYTHRPISPTTGNPTNAQVEWVPFANTNKEMSLKEIFEQVNDKIDSAFGVPASIRGVNDNNTYASVRVDEQIFMKYAVKPFTMRIWTRFTHELNRVTGGLGFAITFDLDIPGVADEEKVIAERKRVEFGLIKEAMDAGFNLDSVVEAFELSNGYKLLNTGYQKPTIQNDKPDVDEGDEVEDAPDATTLEQKSVCEHGITASGGSCMYHECAECSHKIADPDDPDVVEQISKIVRKHMDYQIEQSIKGFGLSEKDAADMDQQELTYMVTEILTVIMAYMAVRGAVTYTEGIALLVSAGIAIDNVSEYVVSEITKSQYRAYLTNVAQSYTTDTANAIRDVLAKGQTLEWDKETIARNLREIMDTDEWRVQRLARTEEHRTFGQSSVDAMTQLMNETGTKIYKIWHTNGDACEFCQAMEGKRELVSTSFLPTGDSVEGVDGGTFLNTFVNVNSASLHPNCHCYVTYEIEKEEK